MTDLIYCRFLSDDGLTQCTQNGRKDSESVIKTALDVSIQLCSFHPESDTCQNSNQIWSS